MLDIPPDKITATHSWTKNFEIFDFEKYKNDSTEPNQNLIYCYTDGSKVGENSGLAEKTDPIFSTECLVRKRFN